MDKQAFTVAGATLPFLYYEMDGFIYYEFDASQCEPPEPMVNAVHGLKLLDAPNKRLRMINMQEPTGLYPRIAEDFIWEVIPRQNGDVEILFQPKIKRRGNDD